MPILAKTLPYFGDKMLSEEICDQSTASMKANIGSGCVDAGEFCRPRASAYVCECLNRSLGRLWEPLGPAKAVVVAAEPNTPHR